MPASARGRAARSLALAGLLALGACAPRVVVRGESMAVDRAEAMARADLARIEGGAAGLSPAARADRLEALADRYPGVPASAEALHRAAAGLLAAGDAARAATLLRRLLLEYPLDPGAARATYDLALADLRLGRSRDGLATLASAFPSLPPAEQPDAARAAAAAAEAAHAAPDAVRWWGEVAAAGGPDAPAALARAAELIDGALAFVDVARLAESLPPASPVLPTVIMKLVRIRLHLHDLPGAREAATMLLARWPASPWAAPAREVLARLDRLGLVHPDVLGVAVPLSGPYQRWGEVIVQAITLALGEGSPVHLAVRDSRGEPDGAAAAIDQLVLDDGAIAVVGGVTNAEAARAAEAAVELQVPLVTLAKQAGVADAGPWVFQDMLTARAQARALAELFMDRRGLRRFGLLFPAIPYGTELANAFWDEIEARGGEIRAVETYATDRTTFTPLVKSMVGKLFLDEREEYATAAKEIARTEEDPFRRRKALERLRDGLAPIVDFDAILIADFASRVKLIAPALGVEDVVTDTCEPEEVERIRKATGRDDLRPVQLLGGNGWGGDPSLFDLSPGGAGRAVRCAVYVDGFFAGSSRPETRRFADAYARRYGATPTILEASAFDAAGMIRAVEAAGAATRDAVREGLSRLAGYHGATGDITMGPDRTPRKALFYLTVGKDGLREMTPEELAGTPAGTP